MTEPSWNPELPWMKFDGSNGEQIAETFTAASVKNVTQGHEITIFVNPSYTGESLSLSQTFPNSDHIGQDRWRVPVGYWLNTETGEVRNSEGTAMDWDDLVQMG